ncbi:glycosyltransferase family 2 protein [Rhodoferax sp. BLA1]|uniref:glycosyltransferase family 2 protein n=1 Tax=Rhodoferax sp. BLA1 TaxID=2576062 RepID=UPI0015D15E65|nr:glycosyltransferase family 2 protein [Rhodoferax sp. BLA1]
MNISTVWVVIAAYNEECVIGETVKNVLAHLDNVIVVDDCSVDDTKRNALNAGAHVLRHPINLGQGGALQTGIEYALKCGAEYIVTFDADGQHSAAEILPMLLALQESRSDIALGSRFLGKTLNLPWQRRWVLKLAIIFTRLTGGIKLTDVHNGFRIMSRSFCMHFQFRQNRMAHASEILNHISSHGIKYIEFPVTITYTEYSIRKGQRSSNALRVLMELFMGHVSK